MSHVYISYHPNDVDRLFEVHEALRKVNVADAFQAYDTSQPKFTDQSKAEMSEACCVILLVSETSQTSKPIRQEIDFALERHIPVFSVKIDAKNLNPNWGKMLADSVQYDLSKSSDNALTDLISEVRQIYEARCPVVSVMNLKGGVGKTTITSQIFGYLQHQRKNRVLLIDFDPQFNLTQFFLSRDEADERIENDQSVLSLFEPGLLTSSVHPSPALDWTKFNDAIFSTPEIGEIARPLIPHENYKGRFELICGQFELTKFAFLDSAESLELARSNLQQCIDRYRKDFDLIVIDTNPSASFLTRVTLDVTDHILAPVLPNEYSLRGLRLLDMILRRFSTDETRPDVSVLFNGVPKSQQNQFERDARDGIYDKEVGFDLTETLLSNALYHTAYLDLKSGQALRNPVDRLAVNSARGPFASDLKRRLGEIATEFFNRLPNTSV